VYIYEYHLILKFYNYFKIDITKHQVKLARTMFSFEKVFNEYRDQYAYKHGHDKLEKVRTKVLGSSNLKKLCQMSVDGRLAPSAADFGASIHTMAYFIFAGTETTAMGELFAFHFWNESVNKKYGLINDYDLCHKVESTFKRYQIKV